MARVLLHLDQYKIRQALQQRLQQSQKPDITASEAEEQYSGLEKVVHHLQQHLNKSPSLDELANIASTNRTSLNQQFHLLYQMSVFDWWREQRLQQAAKLLKNSNFTILEIAQKIAYRSSTGFGSGFKSRFGISPKKYRELYKLS